jgi:hypothetical protein
VDPEQESRDEIPDRVVRNTGEVPTAAPRAHIQGVFPELIARNRADHGDCLNLYGDRFLRTAVWEIRPIHFEFATSIANVASFILGIAAISHT